MSLYERIGGFDTILTVVKRWHTLCLAHPVAAHPFEHGMHPYHDERFAAYLAEAFGGPKLYSAGYGDESHVQRIHAGNGDHPEMDEACSSLFDQALTDCEVEAEAAIEASNYFRRATESQRPYAESADHVPQALSFNYAQ